MVEGQPLFNIKWVLLTDLTMNNENALTTTNATSRSGIVLEALRLDDKQENQIDWFFV